MTAFRLVKEMQLEDQELGLGGDGLNDTVDPQDAALESSNETEREAEAVTLAKGLAGVTLADIDDAERTDGSASDHEVTPVYATKSKKAKRKKIVAMGVESDPEDDLRGLGIARKGRRGKGKGRSGLVTPLDGDSGDEVEELPDAPPGLANDIADGDEVPLAPTKGKKGRRAKGKSKDGTPDSSAPATPAPELAVQTQEPTQDSSRPIEEEMSKRERRKLREAAKMAEGPDELVSSTLTFMPSLSRLTHGGMGTALQRLLERISI